MLKLLKNMVKKYGTNAERAVYNGPFKVTNWQVEDKIQLVKIINIGIRKALN